MSRMKPLAGRNRNKSLNLCEQKKGFVVFSFSAFLLFDSERQAVRASAESDRELAVNKLYKINAGKQWTKIFFLDSTRRKKWGILSVGWLVGRRVLCLFFSRRSTTVEGDWRCALLLLSHWAAMIIPIVITYEWPKRARFIRINIWFESATNNVFEANAFFLSRWTNTTVHHSWKMANRFCQPFYVQKCNCERFRWAIF